MRVRRNFQNGTVTDSPLAIGATAVNSAEFANLPVIAAPNYMAITIDPTGTAPEVVWITAHTASATVATVVRGREGSAAKEHAANTSWTHAPTVEDVAPTDFVRAFMNQPSCIHAHDFDEASGNVLDFVGAQPLVVNVNGGTITYGQADHAGGTKAIRFQGGAHAQAAAIGDYPVGAAERTFVVVAKASTPLTSEQEIWGYGQESSNDRWFNFKQTANTPPDPAFAGWGSSADFTVARGGEPLDGKWHVMYLATYDNITYCFVDGEIGTKGRTLNTGTVIPFKIPYNRTSNLDLTISAVGVFDNYLNKAFRELMTQMLQNSEAARLEN